MNEIKAILDAFDEATARGERSALATIARGSAADIDHAGIFVSAAYQTGDARTQVARQSRGH